MRAAFLFCLALVFPCLSATYTVAPSNADFSTVIAAAAAAEAGDTVIVSNGMYTTGGSVYPGRIAVANDGDADNWITFQAAEGNTPTTGMWFVSNRHYITVKGFTISVGNAPRALDCNTTCSWIRVENNTFNGVYTAVGMRGSNILVQSNVFQSVTNDMVILQGRENVVRGNLGTGLEGNIGGIHMDFFQSGCIDTNPWSVASNTLLEGNRWYDNTGNDTHWMIINDTECNAVTNIIVRRNFMWDLGSGYGGIDDNVQHADTERNPIYGNTMGLWRHGTHPVWTDYAVVYNGSENSAGINNIIYDAMDPTNAIGFLLDAGGWQSHNLYYDPDVTISFTGAASSETGAVKNLNPGLVDPANADYSITTNSPAFDAGGPLTYADGSGDSSTNLTVDSPMFFQPGWAGVEADAIAVGSTTNAAQISTINYDTGVLTLTSAISWSDNDPVWLYADSDGTRVLYGAAPDIGAFEVVVGEGAGGGGSWPEEPDGVRWHIRGGGG